MLDTLITIWLWIILGGLAIVLVGAILRGLGIWLWDFVTGWAELLAFIAVGVARIVAKVFRAIRATLVNAFKPKRKAA